MPPKFNRARIQAMKYLALLSIGIILWPLLEYLLHRFSGHVFRFPPIFFNEHKKHHAKKDYFAPKLKKLGAAIIFLSLLTLINTLWLNSLEALVFSTGFVGMYLFYEYMHYQFHISEPKTKAGLILRKHHFYHHFHNSSLNHGVTSTFLDRIFGTYSDAGQVKIPRRYAMTWLFDENNQVKKIYQKDFLVTGRASN
ncbi:MAG: hypothetical protein COW01_02840 [Bdellovibrionales bacterium CG12_big_fil_rev_8_21_14_0_65_38_15]|nr:MAG: hypothetical protein COW79_08505 [Bdellovibrionales bacterium CG22_combo_CG10-13_8_21_14_all_38_13]PIQ57029.1 MAG: hypothetical protein COW01_02840 [Bdellovibrionales bacterium CG12_big_fil_rev_8_21_14_0_65_38_15]PIR29009.1 MAG: hypothetical protein COV38_12280 [Bdellovibrionales bacterium CG11_big_fil_rev_8_21_14_0_20_38_13]